MNNTLCGISVKDLVKQSEQIRIINNDSFLAGCYNSSTKRFIFNLITTYLNHAAEPVYKDFLARIKDIDFAFLFHGVPETETWEQYIARQCKKLMSKKKHTSLVNRSKLISLLEKSIPAAEMQIANQQQKISYDEISVILKIITNKILRNNKKLGSDYAILARSYFTCQAAKDYYKKITRRTINNHKLGRIMSLLTTYGFIVKDIRFDFDLKTFKPNSYKLGCNNPYLKALVASQSQDNQKEAS